MKQTIIAWIIEWLLVDLISYLLLFIYEDLTLAIATAVVIRIIYRTMVRKQWLAMRRTISRKKEMDYWMNALVVQTSVTPSLVEAVRELYSTLPHTIQSLVVLDDQQPIITTMEPLIYYFNHPLYTIFHRLMTMYVEQGGSLVTMTRQVLLSVTQDQQDFHRYLHASHRRMRELTTGWIFTIITLVYLKLILPRFYSSQLSGGLFQFAIAVNFVLFSYSYWLFFKHYRPLNVEKGWEIE